MVNAAIIGAEINDFLAFKGKFTVDFCLGANGTGKTTLIKVMYIPKPWTPANEILPALNLKAGDWAKLSIIGSLYSFKVTSEVSEAEAVFDFLLHVPPGTVFMMLM
jgi:hypothetical protein